MDGPFSAARRATLKGLGAIGAAMVLGGTAEASWPPAEPDEDETAQAGDLTGAVDVAIARFGKPHSCAQSVFSAFAERLGMDCETAVKVASGFGGNMGGAPVCGAVVGAFMAIGLKYGGTTPEARKQMPDLVQEFTNRFTAQHRSVNCRDLLGCDPSTPEGLQTALEKNLFAGCTQVVADAARIVNELLSRGA